MSGSKPEIRISRRALLKVITAAGGSLGASTLLPGKWIKPALHIGVLPVHAQTSGASKPAYQIVSSHVDYTPGYGYLSNMSVTIAPPDDGVPMVLTICDLSGSTPYCQEYNPVPTVAGVAAFDLGFPILFETKPISVTMKFGNPAQCTSGKCSVEYRFP